LHFSLHPTRRRGGDAEGREQAVQSHGKEKEKKEEKDKSQSASREKGIWGKGRGLIKKGREGPVLRVKRKRKKGEKATLFVRGLGEGRGGKEI